MYYLLRLLASFPSPTPHIPPLTTTSVLSTSPALLLPNLSASCRRFLNSWKCHSSKHHSSHSFSLPPFFSVGARENNNGRVQDEMGTTGCSKMVRDRLKCCCSSITQNIHQSCGCQLRSWWPTYLPKLKIYGRIQISCIFDSSYFISIDQPIRRSGWWRWWRWRHANISNPHSDSCRSYCRHKFSQSRLIARIGDHLVFLSQYICNSTIFL